MSEDFVRLFLTQDTRAKNVEVAAAIREREGARTGKLIADREARQMFWTETMLDGGAAMRDRLKASELLGKSEGDFLDRVEAGVQIAAGPAMSPLQVMEELRRRHRGEE